MGAGKDGSRPLPAPCLNQQMDRVRAGVRDDEGRVSSVVSVGSFLSVWGSSTFHRTSLLAQ